MVLFTFIPVWVIQDVLVLAAAVVAAFFIIRREERPLSILMEMTCFVFLYAAVYENFATMMGWYGYGKSLVMIFNVPLSVPIIEYLVVYTSLRMLSKMKIPVWCKPVIAGFLGMLFDLTLDPVAIRQVFNTREGLIGRWTWYPGPQDAVLYGEPVYNFTGWVLLCGYAAAFLLLGRWLHKKSDYHPVVGILYPAVVLVAALGTMITPLSGFLLWLAPVFKKGSFAEWIMLGFFLAAPVLLLVFCWKGKMKEALTWKKDYPVFLVLIGFPVLNLVFCVAGGYFIVLWLVLIAGSLLSWIVWYAARKRKSVRKTGA